MGKQKDLSIFRKRAIAYYESGSETAVLPRLVRPRIFFGLWSLLVLAMVGLASSWFLPIPVYISGVGVVMAAAPPDGLHVAVFLPWADRQPPAAAPRLFLQAAGSERLLVEVESVSAGALSPADIHAQFGHNSVVQRVVTQPALVLRAKWEAPASALPADLYVGSVFSAEVEVGDRRVWDLIPVNGRFRGGRP